MQLSPIQCTYSNIFIRFFKFFPANTNIYQNSYRVPVAHCTFEITLLQAIMLTLLFVCAFFSTQDTLYVTLKENQLKYQYNSFVNFNQLLSYIPTSTALYFHIIFSCIYFIKTHLLYMIARVSF